MFIGRERELASLKEFYDKDGIALHPSSIVSFEYLHG